MVLPLWCRVPLTMLLLASLGSAAELSDGRAKELIEQRWTRLNPLFLLLGDLSVKRTSPFGETNADSAKGELTTQQFGGYQAVAQMGIVVLSGLRDLEASNKRNFSWADFNKSAVGGVQATFKALPGPKAGEYACKDDVKKVLGENANRVLCVPVGACTLDKLVRNEPRAAGAEEYRVVMGVYTCNWTAAAAALISKFEERPVSSERKFSVVLKHDPFETSWKVVAEDYANRSEEFRTKNSFELISKIEFMNGRQP